MRKFVKGCVITAAVITVLGFTITLTAVAVGGKDRVREMIRNGEFMVARWNDEDAGYYFDEWEERIEGNIENYYDNHSWEEKIENFEDELDEDFDEKFGSEAVAEFRTDLYDEEDEQQFQHRLEELLSDAAVSDRYYQYETNLSAAVNQLEITATGGALVILPSDTGTLRLVTNLPKDSNLIPKINPQKDGDTFQMKEQSSHARPSKYNDRVMVLYVPENLKPDKMELMLGGVMFEAEALYAKDIEINLGAGMAEIKDIEADSLELDVGAGETAISNANVRNADFNVGVGSLIFEGRIKDQAEAACGTGSMEFLLQGKETDYNYEVNAGIGSVTVEDESYTIGHTYASHGASAEFRLNVAIGSIDIKFKE